MFNVGIDIGGTAIKMGIVNSGTVIDKVVFSTAKDPDVLVKDITLNFNHFKGKFDSFDKYNELIGKFPQGC